MRGSMEFIKLTKDNIETEHICCAISDKKSKVGYAAKKKWLAGRLDQGYVFLKLNERAKVFMEYCPSEIAFLPIDAPNFVTINCFWVSGKYKRHGYGKALLNQCIADARQNGRDGLVVLAGDKKKPFMSDGKFFKQMGFTRCDESDPYFELLYLPLRDDVNAPKFKSQVKMEEQKSYEGIRVYYSNTCPYMNYYVEDQKQVANSLGVQYEAILIDSVEDVKQLTVPVTIFSLHYEGRFITQELMAKKKLSLLIEKLTSER